MTTPPKTSPDPLIIAANADYDTGQCHLRMLDSQRQRQFPFSFMTDRH